MSNQNESADSLKWVDEKCVQKCVQNCHPSEVIIIHNYEIESATKKGDNYTSYLYRVTVSYSFDRNDHPSTMRMIMKLPVHENHPSANIFAQMQFYEKEMEMYDRILPRINSLLNEFNYMKKISARTYFVSTENKVMVFEDLKDSGYQLDTLKNGFDMIHTKLVLSQLAKFHAAAAVLQEKEPDIFQNFEHGKAFE